MRLHDQTRKGFVDDAQIAVVVDAAYFTRADIS